MLISKSKLAVFDVDGVFTDGTKIYGINGQISGKRFCDRDFTAVKKFKMAGWQVYWLSADKTVNQPLAKARDITFLSSLYDDRIDKIRALDNLLETWIGQYRLSDVIYAGDDLFDIDIVRHINDGGGMTFCPANSAAALKKIVGHVLKSNGGDGAVMEIMDFYGFDGESPWS